MCSCLYTWTRCGVQEYGVSVLCGPIGFNYVMVFLRRTNNKHLLESVKTQHATLSVLVCILLFGLPFGNSIQMDISIRRCCWILFYNPGKSPFVCPSQSRPFPRLRSSSSVPSVHVCHRPSAEKKKRMAEMSWVLIYSETRHVTLLALLTCFWFLSHDAPGISNQACNRPMSVRGRNLDQKWKRLASLFASDFSTFFGNRKSVK